MIPHLLRDNRLVEVREANNDMFFERPDLHPMLLNFTTTKERFMNRVSRVLVLAVLIMTWGLFVQQKNVAFAQPTAVSQGNIMIADNLEVQKTTTTTKEKRKHHHHKKHHDQRKTTTTTERPSSEENRTNTTTTTEIR